MVGARGDFGQLFKVGLDYGTTTLEPRQPHVTQRSTLHDVHPATAQTTLPTGCNDDRMADQPRLSMNANARAARAQNGLKANSRS